MKKNTLYNNVIAVIASFWLIGCGGDSGLKLIQLSPSVTSTPLGIDVQMLAVGTFTDGTTAGLTGESWVSSNNNIATVSTTGVVTPVAVGNTTISVTKDGISTETTSFKVVSDTPLYCDQYGDLSGLNCLPTYNNQFMTITATPSKIWLDENPMYNMPTTTEVESKGEFYTFNEEEAEFFCIQLQRVKFNGKSDWKQVGLNTLVSLQKKAGDMSTAAGWPTSIYYRTNTELVTGKPWKGHSSVNMKSGEYTGHEVMFDDKRYTGCVSTE